MEIESDPHLPSEAGKKGETKFPSNTSSKIDPFRDQALDRHLEDIEFEYEKPEESDSNLKAINRSFSNIVLNRYGGGRSPSPTLLESPKLEKEEPKIKSQETAVSVNKEKDSP